MSKLIDTQLIILSAASQRDDRGVKLPANLKGEAARKVVVKLIGAGLLEEVRATGSLPVWRRDDERGPIALCITKNGLEAINVEGAAKAAPKESSVRHFPTPDAEKSAPKGIASRKHASVAAQKSARKKQSRVKAKTKAGSRRESRPGSKQARVLAMLGRTRSAASSLVWCARGSASNCARRRSTVIGSIASSTTGVLVPFPAHRTVARLEHHGTRGGRSGATG